MEIACECQMPSPLEDRIRELCLKAAVAQNEADLDQIIRQLRAALTEYIHDARIRAVEVIPRTFRSDKKTARFNQGCGILFVPRTLLGRQS